MNLLPLGVPGQWVWRLREASLIPGRGSLAAFCAALLAALIILDRLRGEQPPTKQLCAWLLVVVIVLGTVMALGVALDDPSYWLRAPSAIISDISMGYYQQAIQLRDVRSYLAGHEARAADRRMGDRIRTHPPGPVLFCHALRLCFLTYPSWPAALERSLQRRLGPTAESIHQTANNCSSVPLSPLDALIALLVALILTTIWVLIALPVFGIGAVIFNRRVGLILALLAVSLPSLLHFTPSIDGFGAVLAASFVYLWLLALKGARWWAYVLASAATAIMLMWSFGFLALGLLALVVAIPMWRQASQHNQFWPHGRGLVVCIAAFTFAYLAVYLWSGYNVLLALPASLAAHRQILASWGRSYWIWLPMNLYDFLLFMGPALVVVAGVAIYQGLAGRRWPLLARGFVWGLLITLALLVISGSTRGEVGRIWVFLMLLAALPAADKLAELRGGKLFWTGAGLVALQIAFAITLAAKLEPILPY